MREHSVTYTGEEYFLRLGVYLSNAKYVQNFNKQKKSFKLALNKFATWTPAEYRTLLSKVPLKYQKHDNSRKCTLKEIPDEIDWRDQNIVTPVVDQMMCASGWCFASTTAQESQWARVKGELQKLSDQNLRSDLIECCWTNQNCEGGWADAAAYYVLENQGGKYMLASDWPYTGYFSDQCNFDASKGVQNLVEVLYAKSGDEQGMKEKCAEYGVLATAIDDLRVLQERRVRRRILRPVEPRSLHRYRRIRNPRRSRLLALQELPRRPRGRQRIHQDGQEQERTVRNRHASVRSNSRVMSYLTTR